ncbi:hypothetical protein Bacsa_1673 [Phocaeicola salanitronis DSM 18170]|uniref:Uncharacterized protein n=1 Tax=Phocaeicola salanitronis (strain DSM 18170 / JCM 13657 / CCUG 60908 / BL78) TaxID=667015 RepID=F0R0N2_PHOSB|nr:hypothetical protein Bacsa_1673 [Phocaeicola salanitronis DSM 18170]
MNLYALAAAPISAGFRNWLRFVMILYRKIKLVCEKMEWNTEAQRHRELTMDNCDAEREIIVN